ncbi:S41 family peptidase [Dyadobacter aurulentus]|uniref:S41 family peptidase n=1 Tax=Dyadobacter sp. UC 10 TaxID=2605428 RepID=UPI0011F3CDD1|nr:S41 family peptidase [Dyadobacter sp. UC 10]KAA0992286.1 S41 family peptidase [Dyadobacter sp. UC 10]
MRSILLILTQLLLIRASYSQSDTARSHLDSDILDKSEIEAITAAIPRLIENHYVDSIAGSSICSEFRKLSSSGKYLRYNQKKALADELTKDLREISKDGHLYVQGRENGRADSRNWEQLEKGREQKYNYGFTRMEILDDDIAYLRITEFMHPKRSMQTAVAAMKLVENRRNLIIDLRGNGGGYPGIMEYILNHYFDGEPIEISTTKSAKGTCQVTLSSDLIYGKLRIGTPLYILIDHKTASAAEYFAYTLQAFKKAIVVGQPSAGGANRNEYFDLPAGLRMSVSIASPVNPVTQTNWEGKGVIPDIATADPERKSVELIRARDGK